MGTSSDRLNFALSEEQAELAATVRSLLDKRADSAAVRAASTSADGHDGGLWTTLCEIGVPALAVPEEYDGIGASFFETAVVLEELGRSLAPSPLLATAVAAEALLAGGTDEARQRLLPRIASGETATIVLDTDRPALDADRAAIVLAVVGGDLVEVDLATTSPSRVETMDQSIRLAGVDLSAAGTTAIGDGAAARARASLVGAAAVAALAVGLCQRALDMTVDYAKEREQFGRPIGSFQALKHRMAEMLLRTELARSASWAASYAISQETDDAAAATFQVQSAASYSLEAASHLAGECVQLHGGIAITWEHDAHLVFKRAHALGQLFGAPHAHRAAVEL